MLLVGKMRRIRRERAASPLRGQRRSQPAGRAERTVSWRLAGAAGHPGMPSCATSRIASAIGMCTTPCAYRPTGAVELPHLLRIEVLHVRRRVGLQAGRGILRKRQLEGAVEARLGYSHRTSRAIAISDAEHERDRAPDEALADIGRLMACVGYALFPLQPCEATASLEPCLRKARSAMPAARPSTAIIATPSSRETAARRQGSRSTRRAAPR